MSGAMSSFPASVYTSSRRKTRVTAGCSGRGSIVRTSLSPISRTSASRAPGSTMPDDSRPRRLMYRPFSPRPYARVAFQSMSSKEAAPPCACGPACSVRIAVVAQPGIQVEGPAPRDEPMVRHDDEEIVGAERAAASGRRSRPSLRTGPRRRRGTADRPPDRRRDAADPWGATSCARPDRRCRSSRTGTRRSTRSST